MNDKSIKQKKLKKIKQYGGNKMKVKGICIHNTGNKYSAKQNYQLLANSNSSNGCHYLIDDVEIIQVMDDEVNVYHTGNAYDRGNMETIAIEICKSTGKLDEYLKAETRAIKLIQKLINKYKLTNEDIYFHNDFNNRVYCPHKIFELYGSKKNFINLKFKFKKEKESD